MAKVKSTWTYGDQPHQNWKELALHLKDTAAPVKPKKTGPSLHDRFDVLEKLLKEKS